MNQQEWLLHKRRLMKKVPIETFEKRSFETLCKLLAAWYSMKKDLIEPHLVLMSLFSSIAHQDKKGPAFCFYGTQPGSGKTAFCKAVINCYDTTSGVELSFDALLGYRRFANKTLWDQKRLFIINDSERELPYIPKERLSMLFDTQKHTIHLSVLKRADDTTFEANTEGKVFFLTSNARLRDDNEFSYLRRRVLQVKMEQKVFFHSNSKYTETFDEYRDTLISTILSRRIKFFANSMSEKNNRIKCSKSLKDFALLLPYFRRARLKTHVCLFNALYTNKKKEKMKPLIQYLQHKQIIEPDRTTGKAGYFKVLSKRRLRLVLGDEDV